MILKTSLNSKDQIILCAPLSNMCNVHFSNTVDREIFVVKNISSVSSNSKI